MYLTRPDQTRDPDEWRAFVRAHPFGQLIAAGRDREVPVIPPVPCETLDVLRRMVAVFEAPGALADPDVHRSKLPGIRAARLHPPGAQPVTAKFKYGGNVDAVHRRAVADRLAARDQPGDEAARAALLRRLENGR